MSCAAVSSGDLVREHDAEAIAAAALAGLPDEEPGFSRPPQVRKGRGATVNPAARFDAQSASPFDDGWDTLLTECGDLPPLPTTLIRDASRSVISWNESPDIGFDRAVNPYRGCEHGCIYCYARPTHAYLGYSPGLDFETKLIFKPEVGALLERELRKPGYVPRTLALGSNTDPYQPVERTLKLTRSVLEVLERFNHPVAIVTKSAGVLRDLDILRRMAERRLARVYLSVTTLDAALARRMEPRAAAPGRRIQAIAELARAGVPVGVMCAPVIPGLNDPEIERILKITAAAGARYAGYVLLRLPHELRALFDDWLQTHFPDRAQHVLKLIRETRAGALNESRFHHRFTGHGVYADMLIGRFTRGARAYGLNEAREELDTGSFAVPGAPGHIDPARAQMTLF